VLRRIVAHRSSAACLGVSNELLHREKTHTLTPICVFAFRCMELKKEAAEGSKEQKKEEEEKRTMNRQVCQCSTLPLNLVFFVRLSFCKTVRFCALLMKCQHKTNQISLTLHQNSPLSVFKTLKVVLRHSGSVRHSGLHKGTRDSEFLCNVSKS